jgi:Flp pilus assembly protein TadG
MRLRRFHGREHQRGQGLVEFALVLPLFLMLLLIMLEFGIAYNHLLTVGLASREGARTGASLGNGDVTDCSGGTDPSLVDAQIIAGLQRILNSPGSDVILTDITQVRIYKADSAGAQIGNFVDLYTYTGNNTGVDVDPGAGVEKIAFTAGSIGWPVCSRVNGGATPDAVGVQIKYNYHLQTALGGIMSFLRGNQPATIAMNDQTVMVLNP